MLIISNKTNRAIPINSNLTVPAKGSITVDIEYSSNLANMERNGLILVAETNESPEVPSVNKITRRRSSKKSVSTVS